MTDALLSYSIRIIDRDIDTHGNIIIRRAVLELEDGVSFTLDGTMPPLLSVRGSIDADGCPVIQLLGRHRQHDPWRVLQQQSRVM